MSISKRKANSPCVSTKVKSKNLDLSANSMSESDLVEAVMLRVSTKNDEPFTGILTRPQAFQIWKKGLNLPGNLIYGIALIFTKDKPFLIKYQLHDPLDLSDLKPDFKLLVDENEYAGSIVPPKPPVPQLGEEVLIKIVKTRFNLNAEQINQWIGKFGVVVKSAAVIEANDVPGIKTDDFEITAKLRKHVPSVMPAFGTKMFIRYPGQPLQCNACYQYGHLRARCENPRVDWMAYAKVFLTENIATKEMIGKWLVEKKT